MPDDDDARVLFELSGESAGRGSVPAGPAAGVPVSKTFRAFAPGQGLLLPPSLDDWLPAGHLARFVAELVDEHLDLSRIRASYTRAKGAPPYDPRLMVRILLYGYTTGVRSSRALEAACQDVVAFRWLAAGQGPDFRSIARFRRRHLSALGHLFVQALALCQAAGMVRLGRVALDGTKLRANASRRKALRARSRRHVSSPSRPGMVTSSTTTSAGLARWVSRASEPSAATATSYPSRRSARETAMRSVVSSSTTSTVTRCGAAGMAAILPRGR